MRVVFLNRDQLIQFLLALLAFQKMLPHQAEPGFGRLAAVGAFHVLLWICVSVLGFFLVFAVIVDAFSHIRATEVCFFYNSWVLFGGHSWKRENGNLCLRVTEAHLFDSKRSKRI